VKAVIQTSLRLCMLLRSEDYLELVSRCVTDIEVSRFKVQVFALFVFIVSIYSQTTNFLKQGLE
jgi:hypothetical protein